MNKGIIGIFVLLMAVSCTKNSETSSNTADTDVPNTEVSNEQKPVQLKNDAGEEITITYFAEGDAVAVKLQKAGEAEQKLSAKTVNAAGNPIFSNDTYMWEITQEGQAGKLSDKSGKTVEYK